MNLPRQWKPLFCLLSWSNFGAQKSSLGGSTTLYWLSAACEAELHAGPKGYGYNGIVVMNKSERTLVKFL